MFILLFLLSFITYFFNLFPFIFSFQLFLSFSFSFSFLGCSKSDVFGLNCFTISVDISKNNDLLSSLGGV